MGTGKMGGRGSWLGYKNKKNKLIKICLIICLNLNTYQTVISSIINENDHKTF